MAKSSSRKTAHSISTLCSPVPSGGIRSEGSFSRDSRVHRILRPALHRGPQSTWRTVPSPPPGTGIAACLAAPPNTSRPPAAGRASRQIVSASKGAAGANGTKVSRVHLRPARSGSIARAEGKHSPTGADEPALTLPSSMRARLAIPASDRPQGQAFLAPAASHRGRAGGSLGYGSTSMIGPASSRPARRPLREAVSHPGTCFSTAPARPAPLLYWESSPPR